MEWANKKVLITGVSGLIGSNIAKILIKLGAKIYSIDNFSYIDIELARKKLKFLSEITIIEGDVALKESWDKLPKDLDYVFHFAGPSSITLYNRTPEKCYVETTLSMYNALEYCKNNKVLKYIYPSSGSNYAGNDMPHNEKVYPRPRNLYGAGKVACEALASSYSDYVKSIGLRIFASFGPGEEWKKDFASAIYLFIRDCMEDKSPVIFGDGTQSRDFIYIVDVAQAIINAAEVDYTGIINIGTGISTSFNDILATINKVLGKNIKAEHIPKEKNYVEKLKADTTLMNEILKVQPRSFEEGITSFVEYIRNS
jgi:UDP-glucose 4-epimerase